METIVLALGGNALGKTPDEQKKAVVIAAKAIVNLVKKSGAKIVVCHGNGPQVGMINDSLVESSKQKVIDFSVPFPEVGAMSQGYIGFHLQNAIQTEVLNKNMKNEVVTLVTQTIVDKNDPAFKDYTKPIGTFMTKAEAQAFAKKNNYVVKEDAGRGWRRVVASPKPKDIREIKSIKRLLKEHTIVIAGGGGGIPVYKEGNKLIGVDAVIDKDFTSAKIAELIDANKFIILTAVDKIKINFSKPNEKSLSVVSLKELTQYIKEGQFAPGSMLPKVEASMRFVKKVGTPAYIGKLEDAHNIILGRAGTKIIVHH